MHQFKETCTDESMLLINDSIVENMSKQYLALQLWILDHPYGSVGSRAERDRDSYRDYFRSELFNSLQTLHDGEWFITELDKKAEYIHLKKIEKEIFEARKRRRQEQKRRKKIWKSIT